MRVVSIYVAGRVSCNFSPQWFLLVETFGEKPTNLGCFLCVADARNHYFQPSLFSFSPSESPHPTQSSRVVSSVTFFLSESPNPKTAITYACLQSRFFSLSQVPTPTRRSLSRCLC